MPAPALPSLPALLRLLLAALVTTALATGCPGPAPGTPEDEEVPIVFDAGISGPPVTLKVMTWNVHDFFDTVDDPDTRDDRVSSTALRAKISELAKVVNAAGPDVLALQEVETEALLGQLDASLTRGMPHHSLIRRVPNRDPRGINVALMSRFPIIEAISHAGDRLFAPDGYGPLYYSRDCLEVHLDIGGNRQMVVLVNHQISQLEDSIDSERKRQAQASRTRQIADELLFENPTRPVLITGDMNDVPSSPTMKLYLDGGAFVDTGLRVGTSDRWTYIYKTQKLHYDYILADQRSAEWISNVRFIHSAAVNDTSDHSPVTVTLTYP